MGPGTTTERCRTQQNGGRSSPTPLATDGARCARSNISLPPGRIGRPTLGFVKPTLRKAELRDRDAIVAFHLALYVDHQEAVVPAEDLELNGYRDFSAVLREDVDAMLRNTSAILFVAEDDQGPCGYITGYVKDEPRRILRRKGVVGDWYVLPEGRGKGIGKALLNGLLDEFRSRQCTIVETTTWPKNTGARQSFEAAGFSQVQVKYRRRL